MPENAPALPCLLGIAFSAISESGFLAVLRLILWGIFLSQDCNWQGRDLFCIPH